MSGSLTKFGIAKETTYGTPSLLANYKAFEIISEDFRGTYSRVQAESLSGAYVDRSDRFAVSPKGASGTVNLEPLTKGFGDWLAFMMGSVATTGPVQTAAYTHTATIGSLSGKSLTVQVQRADETDTLRPWTYEGGKVTNFEFSNSVDQTLRAAIGMDFEKESNDDSPTGDYALATLSTPAGANIFNWAGGVIKVGGSAIDVSEVTVSVDNALNTDRYFIQSTQSKREPKQDGKRQVTWSFNTTYVNNDFWQKVSSGTVAGSFATLEAQWLGPITIPGTSAPPLVPCITLSIPVARFDEGGPVVEGPSMLEQSFSGVGLYDGATSALTITYGSQDATVLS